MIKKILILERDIWRLVFHHINLVLIFFMSLTFYLSTIPGIVYEDSLLNTLYLWVPPNVQNTGHIIVYGILSILWCFYLSRKNLKLTQTIRIAFFITTVFGVFNEFAQFYIPGRNAVISDAILNMIGVGLGLWLFQKRFIHSLKELKMTIDK